MNIKKDLNIFISYGHKETTTHRNVPEVVDAIVEEFEKRNHHIWLDVEKLSSPNSTNWPDSDWRSAIYSAINKSDNVVGFLSEKALREHGVCLDELSIAVSLPGRKIVTVLLESQKSMKIPPTVSRIQWVDMSDWQKHYDFANDCFFDDGYFDEKFLEIADRIEQEENQIYQYDINFLLQTLNPSNTVKTDLFDFLKSERDENGNYIYEERLWLKDKIIDFIGSEKHYLLLTGGPGYGKSQFLAHCIHNIKDVYAYYFIKYHKTEGANNCNLILRTLAFEVAAKMPDYRRSLIDSIKLYPKFSEERLGDISSYFSELSDMQLFEQLFHCDTIHFVDGDPGKVVISIDALDESEINGKNAIVDLLLTTKRLWPSFFKFILTSRETGNILGRFDYFENDVQIMRLDTSESDEDVEKYLRKRLSREEIDDSEFSELTARCEKTFIYARLLIQSIKEGFIELKTIDDILRLPKGYKGLMMDYFDKIFTDEEFDKIKLPLGILVANGGSINTHVLEHIVSESQRFWTVDDFILKMKSFVVRQGDNISFYHKALNDWLKDSESGKFFIREDLYRQVIAEFCKQYIESFNKNVSECYSESTGTDMFEDAEENGFYYDTVKFVFEKCTQLLTKAEKAKFKRTENSFLTLVLWMAYHHSELFLSDEVLVIIKQNAKNISKYELSEQFKIALAYNIAGEAEMARSHELPESSDATPQTVTASNCDSAIEYFWFIQNEFKALPKFGKLYGQVMDNIAFNTRLMDKKSPERLDEALSILENLKNFELRENFDGVEISLAHLYYHEGIIYFDKTLYEESLECLKKSEDYIKEYDEDDSALGEGLRALVLNQRAACNNKIGEKLKSSNIELANLYYQNSISDIKESLNLKIKIYGAESFYAAVAYDNLARFVKFYEYAQPGFKKLSDEVYANLFRAIDIKKRIFSAKGKSTARSYMMMAWCLDADKVYDDNFINYIEISLEIAPSTYSSDAGKLYKNAAKYFRETGDDEKSEKFMDLYLNRS